MVMPLYTVKCYIIELLSGRSPVRFWPGSPREEPLDLCPGAFYVAAGTVSLNSIAEYIMLSNIDKNAVNVYNNKHYEGGD